MLLKSESFTKTEAAVIATTLVVYGALTHLILLASIFFLASDVRKIIIAVGLNALLGDPVAQQILTRTAYVWVAVVAIAYTTAAFLSMIIIAPFFIFALRRIYRER